jgi:Zn-dependent protease
MESFLPPFHWTNLLIIPGLLIGYTVHELAHALTAYFLGDTSQVDRGRITLNPLEHLSWFGTVSFLLFGVGWPKPMQANPYNFKRKYLGLFLVAISGPIASLTLSLVGLLVTLAMAATVVYASDTTTDQVLAFLFPLTANLPETLDVQAWSMAMTGYIATTSFWLTLTSLLPLPGLDGFAAIASLMAFFRERRQNNHQVQPLDGPTTAPDQSLILMNQRRRRNNAAEIHFKVGVEYHQDQEYDDAIARYRQATANDQHFGPAYINMGLAYLAKGKRKEAIRAFRGAIQFADDQKAQAEAWQQLHQLSAVSPVDKVAAQRSMSEMGASPWTDTKPQPNWLGLAISSGLFLIAVIFLYGYLLTRLIELLKP